MSTRGSIRTPPSETSCVWSQFPFKSIFTSVGFSSLFQFVSCSFWNKHCKKSKLGYRVCCFFCVCVCVYTCECKAVYSTEDTQRSPGVRLQAGVTMSWSLTQIKLEKSPFLAKTFIIYGWTEPGIKMFVDNMSLRIICSHKSWLFHDVQYSHSGCCCFLFDYIPLVYFSFKETNNV